jgi:SMC interacting uncharacterized protein involved in chromosome segregation
MKIGNYHILHKKILDEQQEIYDSHVSKLIGENQSNTILIGNLRAKIESQSNQIEEMKNRIDVLHSKYTIQCDENSKLMNMVNTAISEFNKINDLLKGLM